MHKVFVILGVVGLLFARPSYAAVADDGRYVKDNGTRLEWLDLNISSPFTTADVITLTSAPSSEFSGFRVASLAEVQQLMRDLNIPILGGQYQNNPQLLQSVSFATSIFGTTVNTDAGYYQSGFLGFVPSSVAGFYNTVGLWTLSDGASFGIETNGQSALYSANHVSPYIGTFLVRDIAPVPELPTVMMLVSGIAVVLMHRRRKSTHE